VEPVDADEVTRDVLVALLYRWARVRQPSTTSLGPRTVMSASKVASSPAIPAHDQAPTVIRGSG
jgi:hypothetical protein